VSSQINSRESIHKELDADMLDRFERLGEIATKHDMDIIVLMCDWVNGLYNSYDERQSEVNDMEEDRDYYKNRCKEEGIY